MSAIIVLIILATLGQLITCGFSLWMLVGLICRLLFCLRCIGVIFKTKPIWVGEGMALGFMVVWYLLFHKADIPWLIMFLNILFTALVVGLEWLDGILYVYEVLDEDEL